MTQIEIYEKSKAMILRIGAGGVGSARSIAKTINIWGGRTRSGKRWRARDVQRLIVSAERGR